MDPKAPVPSQSPFDPTYEPPQLESVLTPEEVEREVHYAGEATQDVVVP